MALRVTNTGSTCSSDGVTLIRTTLNDTPGRNSWTMCASTYLARFLLNAFPGFRLDEYLPVTHWSHDRNGFGVQFVVGLRKLVPRNEASYSTSDGKNHEGQPGCSCSSWTNSEGSATIFVRAHGTISEQSGMTSFPFLSLFLFSWSTVQNYSELFSNQIIRRHLVQVNPKVYSNSIS